jgi:hypothetical protein
MNRPKWKVFLVVGIAIIISAPAATLRLIEEGSLRCKIVKAVKMEGIERGTSPTTVTNFRDPAAGRDKHPAKRAVLRGHRGFGEPTAVVAGLRRCR